MSKRSSAGGAGAAHGVGNEPRIFAWLATHALARKPLPERLVPNMRVDAVGLQTAYDMDDVGARTTPSHGPGDEGRLFIQSKGGLNLSDKEDSDLGAAVNQAVAQWLAGIDGCPLAPERDRLVIVTDASAPATVRRDLATVINYRLSTAPDEPAARNEGEEEAVRVLGVHIERAWRAQRGHAPQTDELAGFHAVLRLLVLALDDDGSHRTRAETLLRSLLADPEQAANAWESLTIVGQGRNEKQQWYRRHDLTQALRHRGYTLSASVLDPADKAIEDLLAAQIRAADSFTYSLIGRPTPAVDVYVHQTVLAHASESLDAFASQPFHEELARSGSRHLLVFGEAGLGKSTLIRQEAARLAKEAGGTRSLLPLRVSALDLADAKEPLFQAILTAAKKDLGLHLRYELPKDLLTTTADAPWLLLVDGLDEIADPARLHDLLRTLIAHARQGGDGMRIVITSRPLTDRLLKELRAAGFGTYALQRLNHKQLTEFARKWFADDAAADGFLTQARRPELRDLVRVPLMATLAAMLHEDDPDRALPMQRFKLYEQCLGVLDTVRGITPLPDTMPPHCTPVLKALREQVGELTKHLALTQVKDGPRDLLPHALTWTKSNLAGNTTLRDPLWKERVVKTLTDTGLFEQTGSGLRFIHMSFAEHLAAQLGAERLPEYFDPHGPAWLDALKRALRAQARYTAGDTSDSPFASPSWNKDVVDRYTLVHHTYLYPQTATALVCHLQTRGENGRLLAGYLLGEGDVPTDRLDGEPLVATFLDDLRAAVHRDDDRLPDWFHTAGRIRSPLIGNYLLTLATDRRRWPYYRVRAARALADWRPSEAVASLRTLADDATTDPNMLDEIARTLLDIDPTQTEYVVRALRRLLHHPAASPESTHQAAEILASLEGDYVDEAAAVLLMSAVDLDAAPSDRLNAARLLGNLGAANYQARCVRALWAIVDSPEADLFERAEALRELSVLDPPGADEVADEILAFLTCEVTRPQHVWGAVELINASAPLRNDELHLALRTLIRNPDTPGRTREAAEAELRKLLPRERTIPVVPRREPQPEDPTPLAERMCRALGNREEDSSDLQHAALELSELGLMEAEQGAAVLRKRIAETDTLPKLLTIVDVLSELGPAYILEAAEIIRSLLAAAPQSLKERIHAARMLIRFGPQYAAEAFETLRAIAHYHSADAATRDAAIKAMGDLPPEYAPEVAKYLRGLIAAGEADPPSRRRIYAETLGRLSPLCTEEAALALQPFMDDEAITGAERADFASSLAQLGGQYAVEAIAWLRRFMKDPDQPDDDRYHASQTLTDITEKYGHEQDVVMKETQPEFHALLSADLE